jgi:large subunit ribosomal protein L11
MAFCKEFNAATQAQAGMVVPVVITVYQDRSFTFITKSPPAANLIKKALNLNSGSKAAGREVAGKITRSQIMEIVKVKKNDMNARSDEAAMRIIEGTARSMGVEVIDG